MNLTEKQEVIELLKKLNIGFEDRVDSIYLRPEHTNVEGFYYIQFDFDEFHKFLKVGAYE